MSSLVCSRIGGGVIIHEFVSQFKYNDLQIFFMLQPFTLLKAYSD